ncbi:hypothetical protein [Streptomyces tropicalis]|uniref:Uncharacterized protein n=1 Tax=Streptomyces tropicalis TaxID=3034234 RepID=A0ABT6A5Q8_9ACTN|nr:hypothetical protein [Streptomyces tropicalis]MDF3299165.1 hypothetical protein [Streptomyces tropicalis]
MTASRAGDGPGGAAGCGARLPSHRPTGSAAAQPAPGTGRRRGRGRDAAVAWLRVSRTEWRPVETVLVRRLLV